MPVDRLDDTRVMVDDRVHVFETREHADAFERCVQDNTAEFCRTRIRPTDVHRRPLKLRTAREIIEGGREKRRLALEQQRRDSRDALLAKRRAEPTPVEASSSTAVAVTVPPDLSQGTSTPVPATDRYVGKYTCYVVHGHGGHLAAMAEQYPRVYYAKTRIHFFCEQGETTQHTERRNKNNAPTKLVNSWLDGKVNLSRVHQTVEARDGCEPLVVVGDKDPRAWPMQGIWFTARDSTEAAPFEREKIHELSADRMESFLSVLKDVIIPDARRRGLKAPVNVFWIACRARVGAGQGVAEAGEEAGRTA